MKGFGVLRRASMWLAGVAMPPALAVAQTTPTGPQTDPSLDRFSLPPTVRPSPKPTLPTSGPIVAPLSRPTSAAPVVATPTPTPTPTPSAAATPAPRTPTPKAAPTSAYNADAVAGVVNVVTKREVTGVVPTPTPSLVPSASSDALRPPVETASATPEAMSVPATAEPSSDGLSMWLFAAIGAGALALVALGGFLLGRRRGTREDEVVEPVAVAAPEPVPAPPPPAPEPPSGHVTIPARRRVVEDAAPRLEITLIPKRAGTNLTSAAVDYRVVIRNVGAVPARDIRFAMYMLSASARQAQDLQMIFAANIAQPLVASFELAPGQDMELSGMAMLAREQVNVMTIEGKPWFVPVLAMKAEYRWGENVGAPGVATAAHMIGIDRGEGAKMAPFRLDGGAHMHPEVAERKVA